MASEETETSRLGSISFVYFMTDTNTQLNNSFDVIWGILDPPITISVRNFAGKKHYLDHYDFELLSQYRSFMQNFVHLLH